MHKITVSTDDQNTGPALHYVCSTQDLIFIALKILHSVATIMSIYLVVVANEPIDSES